MITPAEIVTTARRWLGTSYCHAGRSRFGLDCSGLLIVVAWELGIWEREFNPQDYGLKDAWRLLNEHLGARCETLPDWREARPGDVILQRYHLRAEAGHAAIVSGFDGTYWRTIHACPFLKRVVEQRLAHVERCQIGFRFRLPK